jgi:NAD(P)-dependent dehydrogenase (short-subunit alcohol dehydrogenase family)
MQSGLAMWSPTSSIRFATTVGSFAEHGKLAPVKRAAQPEEIAEVVAFLASEKSSFIVGAIGMADGGMSVIIQ